MKQLFTNLADAFLAMFHRLTGNKQGMENDFLKAENKILLKKLHEQGISEEDIKNGKTRQGISKTSCQANPQATKK